MAMTARAQPIYLLAGGRGSSRRTPDPGLVAALRAGAPAPRVAYVGAASGDDRSFFAWIGGLLRAAGAGEVRLAPTAGARPNLAAARQVLDDADVIFVSGGDVEEGVRVLRERGLLPLLRRRQREGARFVGVSAGSIMLARAWVRWRDPSDDATAERFACLGLAPVLCDTHAEAEQWEELHALLRRCRRGTRGYGIPTGATLCVQRGGGVAAIGNAVQCFVAAGGGEVRRLPDLRPAAGA